MTLLLIDGNPMVYRAYFNSGDDPGERSDGLPTGAVAGFCSRLWSLIREKVRHRHVTRAALIFDAPGKNWRHQISAAYKANRSAPIDDLQIQLQLARRIAPHFGLRVLEQRGYEADDLIATYTRLNELSGGQTIIATGDKDMGALIRPGVSLYDPKEDRWLEDFAELNAGGKKIRIQPSKLQDVLALAGDKTDNVAGVPGIGVTIAAELIETYGDLKSVLGAADLMRQPKRREALKEYADQARLSRELVALDEYVPLQTPLEDLDLYPPDAPALLAALAALEIRRFADRIAWTFSLHTRDYPPCPAMSVLAEEMLIWRNS